MVHREISIATDDHVIVGDLHLPEPARGMIAFAHGTGSRRKSRRNQFVAAELNRAGFGTLLIDLLTEAEEQNETGGEYRFDVGLLADRLSAATRWILNDPTTRGLPIGYFGASTGAAAALVASVHWRDAVRAVVSRGGRPDLAGDALKDATAATLLLVGDLDLPVIPLNQVAIEQLGCARKKLEIVPGASHLFEEQGKLEAVADLAREWFCANL